MKLNMLGLLSLLVFATGCRTIAVTPQDFLISDARLEANHQRVPDRDLAPLRQRVADRVFEERELVTADGVALRGIVSRQPGAQATVLLFGNNAFRLAQQGQNLFQEFRGLPVNLVQFDYRGYGRSDGLATVNDVLADALFIYDKVRQDFSGRVIVQGHSFGVFVAAYVAGQRQPDGLILEGSTRNAEGFLRSRVPWYAVPFVRFDLAPQLAAFDVPSFLNNYTNPVLLLTGADDVVTTPTQAINLLAALNVQVKQLCVIPGGGHMNASMQPAAHAAIDAFLEGRTRVCSASH